jgi:hypothetical protein
MLIFGANNIPICTKKLIITYSCHDVGSGFSRLRNWSTLLSRKFQSQGLSWKASDVVRFATASERFSVNIHPDQDGALARVAVPVPEYLNNTFSG